MYYNNKSYYFTLIEISFTEFLELRELNQLSDQDIVEDIVESCLGTLNDISYEHRLVMDRDAILIKAWSTKQVHSSMYMISKSALIPVWKPNSLYDVLCNATHNYNFGTYYSVAQSPSGGGQQQLQYNNSTGVSSGKFLWNAPKHNIDKDIDSDQNDKHNGICDKCGSPAYIGLNDFECSKGCK